MAALKWPGPSQQLGTLRTVPHLAWLDYFEEPGVSVKACSLPPSSVGQEAQDKASLGSLGCLSGSSGGHEPCAPPRGPWKERPPQVLGVQRQPRKSDPRLEQLRDKIRAQAQWQASRASLGTSVPSSASHLFKASSPVLRRKTGEVTNVLPAPTHPGLGILHAAARRAEGKAPPGLGRALSRVPQHQASAPRENTKRIRSGSCKREKAPKAPAAGRAAKGKDPELAGVYAWRKGQALARSLLGPPPARPRIQSQVPSREPAPTMELGDGKKAAAAEGSPVHTGSPRPTSSCSERQMPKDTPSLPSHQPATIQTAMAMLQDLRQQIQAGLELARRRRGGQKLGPSRLKPQNLAGRRQRGPLSTQDVPGSSLKAPWATGEGTRSSLDRARSFPTPPPWGTLAEWESCPQRTWAAQGEDPSFQGPRSTPKKLDLLPQRPWSALAGQACPQRSWAVQGQSPSLQRPGSPPQKLSLSSQRPWSTLAAQNYPQKTWAACKDWEASVAGPWSPLERPSPAPQHPQGGSFVQRPGPLCGGRGTVAPPLGAKQAWPEHVHGFPRSAPGQTQEVCQPPPCLRPRGSPGQAHSPESLREFMRQKAQAQRRQAVEQKASAARTLELRNQRLQEVYRRQREAVLSKAVPVVSQKRPGIVTFVPSSAQSGDLEAPGSLGPPGLQWSKVTSGTVLGDQEAPGSFCLCLNRAWNGAETLDTGGWRDDGSGASLLVSAASSLGPLKLQELPPGLCIYLDPQEAECLGSLGPLPFQHKQARLQALETMADVLKQRIDILTTKLQKSELPDTVGPALDGPRWDPRTVPAAPTLTASACPGALVSNKGRGAPQDWVDMPARPLLPTTYLLDGEMLHWSPSWEPENLSPRAHISSQPQGILKKGLCEPEEKLWRDLASFGALGPGASSSEGPAGPDPARSALWLEELRPARGPGLVTPWTSWSCGQQESGGPSSGGLHGGHLADFQLKSVSFLQSLKQAQQRQAQALTLLQQRAQQEVWETQMALDQLLFKHRLQKLMEKNSPQASEEASKPEQLQICGGPEPRTPSPSSVATRPRSSLPQDGSTAGSAQCPEEAGASGVGKEASAELGKPDPAPSQLALARLCSSDSPTHQVSRARPGRAETRAPRALGCCTIAMLEQSLREEELRAQHQAALLRLRELAVEERAHAELAWLDHQRGCLGSKGHEAARAALLEKQQQALSRLEKERREIRYLRSLQLSMHRGRRQLLQHQKAVLAAQRAVACLRQELQTQAPLPQGHSSRVKATWEGGCEISQQLEAALWPLTLCGSSSPTSCHPQRSPESSEATHLSSEQPQAAPPQTASEARGHLQPPGPMRGEDTAEAGGPRVDSGNCTHQGPRERPRVPLPGLLHPNPLDIGQLLGSAFPAREAVGSPTAQLSPQEAEALAPGEPQTKPSGSWAGERPLAPPDSHVWSVQGPGRPSLSGEGPCVHGEAGQVPEGSTSHDVGEPRLEAARSPEGEPQEVACWPSERQRREAHRQEDPGIAVPWLGAAQLSVSSAPAAPEEQTPLVLRPGSPLPQLAAPSDLGSEPPSGPCSGSSEAWASSTPTSAGSASGPSCSSLQEFQKATATLVQLSDSSPSLSSLEAEVTPDADPSWSACDSWEGLSPPLSWGLQGGVPGDVEQMTWRRGEARPLCPSSTEAAVAGSLELASSVLQAGWPLPLPGGPSPRSGSELSEASSQIWDEDSSPGAGSASGSTWPEDCPSDLKSSGEPPGAHHSLGPREGQEASGTSKNLTGRSNTGKTQQVAPKVASTPSSGDLDLSLSCPSGTSMSKGVDAGRGERMLPQALAGCWEGAQDADQSLSTERTPLQASPDPEVSAGLTPPAAKSQAGGHSGNRACLVLEKAGTPHTGGYLSELLSPVDEQLSYSSRDLPSSTQGVVHLPPPPPIPQAKSDPGDFPSQPGEATFPYGLLGPRGEDICSTAEDVSSLSEEALAEALSPRPQGGGPGGDVAESGPVAGSQAEGGPCSEPIAWSMSSLSEGAGSAPVGLPRPPAQLPTPSGVPCMAGEDLSGTLVAGDTDVGFGLWWGHQSPALGSRSGAGMALEAASGRHGEPWEEVQCFEGAEGQQELGHLLDKRASPRWPSAPTVPRLGPVVHGQAGKEGEGVLSQWAEDQPRPQTPLGRGQPLETHSATGLVSGACADLPGTGGDSVVGLMSMQLSRRILCDSLATLSALAPQGSP